MATSSRPRERATLTRLPLQQRSHPPGPLTALGVLVRFRWHLLARTVRVMAVLASMSALALVMGSIVGAHRLRADGLRAAGVPADEIAASLPVMVVAFLLTVTAAAVGSGGGRETLPADQAVALPIGSTTDHLAALGWAPLTLAWVVPATALAATVSFLARDHPAAAETVVILWLLTATAIAQVLAWLAETVRGSRHGRWAVRVVITLGVVVVGLTLWTGHARPAAHLLGGDLVASLVRAADADDRVPWALGVLGLVVLLVLALRLGDRAAAAAARRPPRAQAALETRRHPLRRARSTQAALRRIDRAGVWRSAPLRRGLALIALLPLALAVSGRVEWGSLPLLPGFFGLGGALLFGVNALSLDASGAWWRESLPVSPQTLLAVRTRVVLEVVFLPAVATLVVGAVRSGPPPGPVAVVAALGAMVVVVARILASVMRWSVTRPYAADLRRPRATPAPPGAMLAYSLRLTLHGVVYGIVFTTLSALADHGWWVLPVTLALVVALVLPSVVSLRRTHRLWLDADRRAAILRTVGSV